MSDKARYRNIYRRALDAWGKEAQVMMAIEEMAELTKELSKDFRGKGSTDHLCEEIADAYIMLKELSEYYGKDKVRMWIRHKIFRLDELLKEGEK